VCFEHSSRQTPRQCTTISIIVNCYDQSAASRFRNSNAVGTRASIEQMNTESSFRVHARYSLESALTEVSDFCKSYIMWIFQVPLSGCAFETDRSKAYLQRIAESDTNARGERALKLNHPQITCLTAPKKPETWSAPAMPDRECAVRHIPGFD